jgi:hypothetical protein
MHCVGCAGRVWLLRSLGRSQGVEYGLGSLLWPLALTLAREVADSVDLVLSPLHAGNDMNVEARTYMCIMTGIASLYMY